MRQVSRRLPAVLAKFRATESPDPHIDRLVAYARETSFLLERTDWCDLARIICVEAMEAGHSGDRHPLSGRDSPRLSLRPVEADQA